MNKKILNILSTSKGGLIFALLCGCAYYIVVQKFILAYTSVGGGFLGFMFLPAIICGAALIILKSIKQMSENENEKGIITLFWMHIVLMILSVVFLISMI